MSLGEMSLSIQIDAINFAIAHPVWTTAISIAVSGLFGEYFEGVPPGTPGPFDEMARIHTGMNRVVKSGLASVQRVRCWRAIPKHHYKGRIQNFFYSLYHVSAGRYNRYTGATYASKFKSTVRAELNAYSQRGPGFGLVASENALAQISARGKVLDLTKRSVRDALNVGMDELVDPNFGGTSLTQSIGETAAEMGFDMIIAPSARHAGPNVIILNQKAVTHARYAGKLEL